MNGTFTLIKNIKQNLLERVNEYLGFPVDENLENQELDDIVCLIKLFCKHSDKEFIK